MTETLKFSRQARFKGRALLFLVFKQNLNPFSWHIQHTNRHSKWIKNEKVMPLKIKGSRSQKKQTTEHYKGWFSNIAKKKLCWSVAIRVQRWVLEFQVALLQHFKFLKINKKVMRVESRSGQTEEKWKKNTFYNSKKNLFSLLLCFGWSFGFAFPRWFVELEKVLL